MRIISSPPPLSWLLNGTFLLVIHTIYHAIIDNVLTLSHHLSRHKEGLTHERHAQLLDAVYLNRDRYHRWFTHGDLPHRHF